VPRLQGDTVDMHWRLPRAQIHEFPSHNPRGVRREAYRPRRILVQDDSLRSPPSSAPRIHARLPNDLRCFNGRFVHAGTVPEATEPVAAIGAFSRRGSDLGRLRRAISREFEWLEDAVGNRATPSANRGDLYRRHWRRPAPACWRYRRVPGIPQSQRVLAGTTPSSWYRTLYVTASAS
jgi:hypothetical protein